eukprot:TRINITY_DN3331_c2_g1_i1.p1 TRINITY_DN3331_c2_g1~~TRINITY_DN3331_c2_g1_i1.p1  ORF type:complete len:196 (-),score=51.68 TRINITY_DN3331_c2_g1_i1:50-637(-)
MGNIFITRNPELEAKFNSLSVDGKITKQKFLNSREVFVALNIEKFFGTNLVGRLFDLIDKDKSNEIDYNEFNSFLTNLDPSKLGQLKLIFDLIDQDGSGQISNEELKKFLKETIEYYRISLNLNNLSESAYSVNGILNNCIDLKVSELFSKIDQNRSLQIDFNEFSAFFSHSENNIITIEIGTNSYQIKLIPDLN